MMIKTFYLVVHIFYLYPLAFTTTMNLNFLNVSLMASRFDILYMCGDFNGQTAEEDDMFDISGDAGNFMNKKRLLESSNIPL